MAHPPCQRWGRFWHGSTRKPHQFKLGDDDGCFAAALDAVRRWGGVLEHPADSHAWAAFNLNRPPRAGGWVAADMWGGWTCHVEQGHYGHFSRKPTWLYAVGAELPDLIWGPGEQRLHPVALARHGYAKARRIGMAAMIGGKRKTEIREATPEPFQDVLLVMARSVPASGPLNRNGALRPAPNEAPEYVGFDDCECQYEDAYAVRSCQICNGTGLVEIETWPAEEPESFADGEWPSVAPALPICGGA